MSLATDYVAYIRASRRLQLAHDANAVRDLEKLLAETAGKLRKDIADVPRGALGERYRRDALASLESSLDEFRDHYKELLDAGIIESARIVEQRERELLQAALADPNALPAPERAGLLLESGRIETSLRNVPMVALERAYARTYTDGLKLSERLYNLDTAARKGAADIVTEGLATGMSAHRMGLRLEALLTSDVEHQRSVKLLADRITERRAVRKANAALPEGTKPKKLPSRGVDNVAYRARRIARTEINTAYREGHIAAATDENGNLRSYISAIGWRLSPAHPRIDICDVWAGDDTEDLGPGNYSPDNVPPGHPHCLCYTVSLLAALPDEQFISRAAQPDAVPDAQRKYYGLDSEAEE
jgi:hypothetical protein